ncbi:MAG: Do family serine endopeptidase [Acidobacteriota bacterium]|nr:Do family serine endopeptidase [Acidobacteriota bacterium]
MLIKISRKIAYYRFLVLPLIVLLLSTAGCKSNFLGTTADSPAQIQPQSPPVPIVVDGVRTTYADVVDKTSPAVVQIEAEVKSKEPAQTNPLLDDPQFKEFFRNLPQQPQQRPRIQRGVGSGVIVSPDGTILTNYHVVGNAEKITVLMNDNRTFNAKIVGTDQPSDLAVLKIEAENLPFLNLGNSDNVRIGDIVLAIGNPLGIGQTVTAGIISAKGRRTGLSDGSFEDFLQTDAPINQGNSGGALVNLSGELIGINSQILSGGGGNIGIGFSIPSNMAKSVMEQLVQTGRVRRGMLGVNIKNITADMARAMELKDTKGVLVDNVRAGSAAEKAGIKRGDIITAINDERVEDSNTLRNKVAGTLPGNSIKIGVLRDGEQQEFTAQLDEFNAESDQPASPTEEKKDSGNSSENGKLGLTLQSATPEILKQVGLPDDTKGLVVMDVDPNGAAAQIGIARGDVIIEINRNLVETTEQVQSALEKSGDRPILLLINRKGQTIYLTVTPGK